MSTEPFSIQFLGAATMIVMVVFGGGKELAREAGRGAP